MDSISVVLWVEKRMCRRIALVYLNGIAIAIVGAGFDSVLFDVIHAPLVHIASLSLGQCLGGRTIVGIIDLRQDKLGSHGRTEGCGYHYVLLCRVVLWVFGIRFGVVVDVVVCNTKRKRKR